MLVRSGAEVVDAGLNWHRSRQKIGLSADLAIYTCILFCYTSIPSFFARVYCLSPFACADEESVDLARLGVSVPARRQGHHE